MKKENITVLRKILYAVESGGQVYGKQNYGAFAGVGADDWGPEYPFIEEDEESDDANS